MSKLETVRTLDSTSPQIEIVRSVRDLQQTVTQMQQDLKALPNSIASETAQALEPLDRLQQDVTRALESFDQITAMQRSALDSLVQEMTDSTTRTFEKKIGGLSETLSRLAPSLDKISTAAQQLETAQRRMTETAARTAMPVWMLAVLTGAAGAVGALVVMIGQSAFGS